MLAGVVVVKNTTSSAVIKLRVNERRRRLTSRERLHMPEGIGVEKGCCKKTGCSENESSSYPGWDDTMACRMENVSKENTRGEKLCLF